MRDWGIKKDRTKHKPLRSFKEMCAELGVPERKMCGIMSGRTPPVPVLSHKNKRTTTKWYDPQEFRQWWNSLPSEVKS